MARKTAPSALLLFLFSSVSGYAQFAPAIDLTSPREAVREVQHADFNNDGIEDLLVVHDDPSTALYLVWYPGTGGGSFASPAGISNLFVTNPEIADMDGDGDMDFTFAMPNERRIGWFANNGSGVFSGPHLVSDSLRGVQSAVPFDLDQDGDMDILTMTDDPVFLDMNSSIIWYENDGSENFPTAHVIFQGSIRDPYDAVAGDLDGDGDIDVAVACLNSDDVTVFFNLGGATSWSGKNVLTTLLIGTTDIEIGDVENDGDLDLIANSVGANRVSLLRNNGSGVFTLVPLSVFGLSTVDDCTDVEFLDANGDGFLDVVAALLDENAVDLFVNTGTGSFGPAQRITNRTFQATAVCAADLDNDGDMDIISASQLDAKLAWYKNLTGAGVYGSNQFINTPAGGVSALATADFDGDGDRDVLSLSSMDQKIALYRNTGGLNFEKQFILDQTEFLPTNMVVTDIDNDGDADIAAIGQNVLRLYRNNGSGVLTVSTLFSGLDNGRGIRAVDLNGDGLKDLVLTSWSNSRLSWFSNLGSGAFGPEILIDTPGGADGLIADDWDGDGDQDLAVSSEFNDQIYYYQNLGGASFAPRIVLASSLNGLFELNSKDVNGDGQRDILFAAFYANVVGYIPNLGGGTFGPQTAITTALNGPYSIDAWDPDGDGDLDVLVPVSSENRTVSIDNLGGGAFGTRRTVLNAYEWHRVALPVDLDGDGDEDLLVGFKNTVTMLENLRLSPPVCSTASAPTGLSAMNGPSGVTLSWNPIAGSVACQVQGRPAGAPGFATLAPIYGAAPTSAFVPASKLTPGTSYEWKVRCACSVSPPALTPFSALGGFSVPLLRETPAAQSWSVYPNPAGEQLNIRLADDQDNAFRIQISDSYGRLWYSTEARSGSTIRVDISQWAPGFYQVEKHSFIQSESLRELERFVKL